MPSLDQKDALQRIMFLCDMSDEFLERGKANFQDARDGIARGGTTVEL